MKNKNFMYLFPIILLVVFIIFSGCTKQSIKPLEGNQGGKIIIGLTGNDIPRANQNLHPLFTGKNPISEQLFLPLLSRGTDGELIPVLAERWEFSEDLSAIVYYLRKDIKWSDGEEFTAEDVKFTFDLILNNDIETPFRVFLEKIESVEITGKYAVKINFEEPYATELIDSDIFPLPSHKLSDITTNEELQNSGFGIIPDSTISNGPFILEKVLSQKEYILIANENYFRGKPPLDKIVFNIFFSSSDILKSLKEKNIDLALNIFPSFADTISTIDNINIQLDTVGNRYYSIGWSSAVEPLSNPRFRYALTYAIDKISLIDELLKGKGRIPSSPVSPYFWGYNNSLVPIEYDIDLSNLILDSLGIKDRKWIYTSFSYDTTERMGRITNIDTIVTDSFHARLYNDKVFYLILASFDNSGKFILDKISSQFEDIGIYCSTVVVTDISELKEKLKTGEISGYILDYALINEGVIHPKQVFGTNGSLNFSNYSSNIIDSLLDAASSTLDRREAKEAWLAFQKTIAEEQPYTFLFVLSELNAINNSIEGDPINTKLASFNIQELYLSDGWEISVATTEDTIIVASIDTLSEIDTSIVDTIEVAEIDTVVTEEDTTTIVEDTIEVVEDTISEEIVELVSTGAVLEEAVTTGGEVSDTTEVITADTTTVEEIPTEIVRTDPKVISLPQAQVPSQATGMGITRAYISVTIGANGSVISAEVVGSSGNPIADAEARAAAMSAKFNPATENGNPVQSQTVIPINFYE